ncbi:MAG: hypothetical protein WC648_01255 [Candidatus Paceibacterota bacterium]|jgi:hypothetical protein
MQEQILQLARRVEVLERENRLLKSSKSIPLDIDQAFRARFLSDIPDPILANSKSASSENQVVDEGGSATYSVLQPPDAFASTIIGTTTIYLPYYT